MIRAALLILLAAPASAASWQVCRIEAQSLGTVYAPAPALKLKVLAATPVQAGAECPAQGAVVTIEPESADWQQMVPRRDWPKTGARLRYRAIFLDGICKNESRPGPCRIRHFPLGW